MSVKIETWSTDRVAKTAAAELARLLATGLGPLAAHTVHLAYLPDLPDRESLIRRGLINLHNMDPAQDPWEALQEESQLYLLGNSPRGLLQAVYALEEALRGPEPVVDGWQREGAYRMGYRIFHPRFGEWPGARADLQFLSRMGASHCLLTHDWQGDLRHLQGYVQSDIFPNFLPTEQVTSQAQSLRRTIDHALDHGLVPALWITELPCQGGPWLSDEHRAQFLHRYPPGVLADSGSYEGRVLCFGHPQVQDYYRELLASFFVRFPEIELLFVFGLDSGGRFCDPTTCPRCQGLSLFEQRNRFLRFLADHGAKEHPGLQVLTTTWGWEEIDMRACVDMQAELPANCGLYMAAGKDGWQSERQNHAFLREMREVTRRHGQLFIGYDDFHWGDDSVHNLRDIQDFPLGIAAKCRRWQDLGVDGVFDHWGTAHELVQNNSIALGRFMEHPHADPAATCREIALRQYGEAVGPAIYAAWAALERAHRCLSNACTWAPFQWPAWYQGINTPPSSENLTAQLAPGHDKTPLPPKPAIGIVYNGGSLADMNRAVADAWLHAGPCFDKAREHLERAQALADDRPIGYRHWWQGEAPVPHCREHVTRQLTYIRAIMVHGREIGLHYRLRSLYLEAQGDPAAYEAAATDFFRQDLAACEAVLQLYEDFHAAGVLKAEHPQAADNYRRKRDWLSSQLTPKANY